MKPSALRIERLLAKVEAKLAWSTRARRYVFYPDEVAEAEAQGLPYALLPRVLSNREWMEKYGGQPVAEAIPGSAPAADTTKKSAPQDVRERA